jgi:hypothetical protein
MKPEHLFDAPGIVNLGSAPVSVLTSAVAGRRLIEFLLFSHQSYDGRSVGYTWDESPPRVETEWLCGSLLAPPAGERWLHPHEGDSCSVSFGPTARGLGRRWPDPTARGLCQSAGQLAARATALTSTAAGT